MESFLIEGRDAFILHIVVGSRRPGMQIFWCDINEKERKSKTFKLIFQTSIYIETILLDLQIMYFSYLYEIWIWIRYVISL